MSNLPGIPNTDPTPIEVVEGRIVDGPLTQETYEQIKRGTESWRDTLAIMLLRNTGFRPYEVVRVLNQHVGHEGMVYWVTVKRAKKRGKEQWEPVYLNPNLGQPLWEWMRWEKGKQPGDSLFGVKERQLRNIVYGASQRTLGYRVEPKKFRRLFFNTVARIAADVLGYAPQHMQVASRMGGHESVRTTWDWYFELTEEQRRTILERVPV